MFLQLRNFFHFFAALIVNQVVCRASCICWRVNVNISVPYSHVKGLALVDKGGTGRKSCS